MAIASTTSPPRTFGPGGMTLLKHWEAIKYIVYLDQGNHPTGGLGHLLTPTEQRLYPVGQPLSEPVVNAWIAQDISSAVCAVNSALGEDAITLTQNQFDALVCFEYNIGIGAFNASSALRDVLAHDWPDVPAAMRRFNKVRVNGQLVVSNGLVHRRDAEVALWNTPDAVVVVGIDGQ